MDEPKVYCILVAYHPRERVLRAALHSIRSQTSHIIVVDNSDGAVNAPDVAPALYLPLGRNMGIAAAQNRGISQALSQGADYVWLSDQDTIYPRDFLGRMLAAAAACKAEGLNIAAIAPAFFDTVSGVLRSFVRHAPFVQGFAPQPGPNLLADAIASGTIIPAYALRLVGLMQEDLFIDWVDIEWCWRARNLYGLQVIGIGDVVIRHSVGDAVIHVGLRKITMRSPTRHYYMTRNAIHLAIYSKVPTLPMRLQIAFRALAWAIVYPLLAPISKWTHLWACFQGILDGLVGRMGQRSCIRRTKV